MAHGTDDGEESSDQPLSSRTSKSMSKTASKPKRKTRTKKTRVRYSKSSKDTSRAASKAPRGDDDNNDSDNDNNDGDNDDDDGDEDVPSSKRKRGNQGNFTGPRLQFLRKSLLEYTKAKPKGACLAKIVKKWFERWPWHDQDEQPERFNILSSQDDSLDEEARTTLVAERAQVREAVQLAGKQQLTRWFWRQAKKAAKTASVQQTPLAPVLRKALG
ncbi:hypothetical protein FB446DRAFT_795682, partial [Lentinula raphanica]